MLAWPHEIDFISVDYRGCFPFSRGAALSTAQPDSGGWLAAACAAGHADGQDVAAGADVEKPAVDQRAR